jgi:DNA-binding NarL/FixJ family response regulator
MRHLPRGCRHRTGEPDSRVSPGDARAGVAGYDGRAAPRTLHPAYPHPCRLGFRCSGGVREAADMAVSLFILVQERTFADALAIRLEREPDMDVVAALDSSALPSRMLVSSQVDAVLLDADLADNAAFRLCQELRQAPDAPYVIFLGQSSDAECIVRAIRAGAVGWVGKDESLARLIYVIRGVARGETWLPPDQTGEVLRLLMSRPDRDEDGNLPLAALTGREREVLLCLAEGNRRRDVAEHLHMSPNTVRTHLQNLMAKLGVHSTLEAVALTWRVCDEDFALNGDGALSGARDAPKRSRSLKWLSRPA